ncbi:MAG: efflux RND transporter permease subunit [Bacteroidales bacterium]|nr:efflux RND transporter permease subunit [Bacteroidales bacterium]
MGRGRKGVSAFSVLLLATAAAVVGIASIGMLNIQYTPTAPGRSIRVSYALPDASARTVDAEVTSLLEGVLSGIPGVSGISSASKRGGGSINIQFSKGTDMATARYEIASRLRGVYDKLPHALSYPDISLDVSGAKAMTALTYELRSPLPTLRIREYAEERIVPVLSRISGVERVAVHGATPFRYVITFDAARTKALGISGTDIAGALRDWYAEEDAGLVVSDMGVGNLVLSGEGTLNPGFDGIPVCAKEGRIVYLRDIADWRYEEAVPDSYFRVNGLNTLTLSLTVSGGTNLLKVAAEVKDCIAGLRTILPDGMSFRLSYDASEYVGNEIRKIALRTVLCLVILLLFVALTGKSFRYTLLVAVTILLNIVTALAIYSFSGLPLHIYTLAGISVSLGIIIDTTIVMADHYRRKRDRGVFPAILGAVATTVGALLLVLLLPETERKNLTDFTLVIIVNLLVSLVVAWFFVPALIDTVMKPDDPLRSKAGKAPGRLRRMAAWRSRYESYIRWGIRHRWLYVVAFIASFGIPLCLIPPSTELKDADGVLRKALYKVASWRPYAGNKLLIDKIAGGSFALFYRAMDRVNLYREPERTVLRISAGMPEGASVSQLNEVVKAMENYLSQFGQIELFTTEIRDYDNAVINVYFKKEAENSGFPFMLKSDVTVAAMNFGGANWRITGVDNTYFNNNVSSSYMSSGIILRGYNFDELSEYASQLRDRLALNRRVSVAQVYNAGYVRQPLSEYNVSYDEDRMALAGINPGRYFSELGSRLYDSRLGRFPTDRGWCSVELRSSDFSGFDLWHVGNELIAVDSLSAKLMSVGSIGKHRSGLDIIRKNQSYELEVAFDFVGNYEVQKRFTDAEVSRMNSEVLPVGYKAVNRDSTWFDSHKSDYAWLILLMILVIYVITAISIESFRLPLAIIWMIPVSFIGTFLVFGLSDLTFDQGGLASFVMLSGLVVNAGIYIVREWQSLGGGVRGYVKAFALKSVPVLLTVLSTVLGLLPFLSDGPREVFWFDFAVGAVAGMGFSVFAIVFLLPVFAVKKSDTTPR